MIDLFWPKDNSVNACIDTTSYLNTEFALPFPLLTISHRNLRNWAGPHLFKIDIIRTFPRIKIDPVDYDLLGLYWNIHFLETCLLFEDAYISVPVATKF